MGSKAGVITGFLLGLLFVGGLAATPLFIDALRSPEDAVKTATIPEVQAIDRAVLNLEPGTALLADIYDSTGDEQAFDKESVDKYADAQGDATFLSRALLQDLERSLKPLEDLNQVDRARGTAILGKGVPDSRNRHISAYIVQDVQPYFKDNDTLLQAADQAVNAIRGTTVAGQSGDQTLAASRSKAVLKLAHGHLFAQRARVEYKQAALARAGAQDLAMTLIELRSRVDSLDAEDPAAAIGEIDERLAALDAGLQQAGEGIARLSSIVHDFTSKLESAQDDAATAAAELSELDMTELGFATYDSKYRELSARQRQAEAAIATLTYGTLANATEVLPDGAEPVPPTYEGGAPQPGLETLTFRLDQVREQVRQLTSSRESLAARRQVLEELTASLNEKRTELKRELDDQTAKINGLIGEARMFTERAADYESKSLAAVADAERFATSAANAASTRSRQAAAKATAGGGEPDERLQRIGSDVDMEASMHCLAAEAAFAAATVHLRHIEAAQAVGEAESLLATILQERPPASSVSDAEDQRVEATNLLVRAAESFDKAEKLLERSNVRHGGGVISGKNYVWQVQVGLAAVHLARAALADDDAEARFNEQNQAYELLRTAIEGREQSPMLATAVDTFEYLQRTAR